MSAPNLSTVTGIRRVGVAILATATLLGFVIFFSVSKVSTVTGIRQVAILVTVVVFELSDDRCRTKLPTVTRMSVPPENVEPHL